MPQQQLLILILLTQCYSACQTAIWTNDEPQVKYVIVKNDATRNTMTLSTSTFIQEYPSLVKEWKKEFEQIPTKIGICQISTSACNIKIKKVLSTKKKVVISYDAEGDCDEILQHTVLLALNSEQDSVLAKENF